VNPPEKFGPGLAPTFAYYFLCCVLISIPVGSQLLGSPFDPRAFAWGVPIAAIVGAIGAKANHSKTIEITTKKPQRLEQDLQKLLEGWQFTRAIAPTDTQAAGGLPKGTIVYQNTSRWRWMSGKVFVNIQGNRVAIASRARLVERIQHHLS
jgi:hypothetical protein